MSSLTVTTHIAAKQTKQLAFQVQAVLHVTSNSRTTTQNCM